MINSLKLNINRWRFRRDVARISNRSFTIISSNCVGGRIYEILGIPYLTPTVGLFFYPECYIKFLMNLNHYLTATPKLVRYSRYKKDITYPIAELDDIEIHFLHAKSGEDAIFKWLRRAERVNYSNIFVTMTDRDGFSAPAAEAFDHLPFKNKVLFTSQQRLITSSILIPRYSDQEFVGDLYSNYQDFVGSFSFSDWIDAADKSSFRIVQN